MLDQEYLDAVKRFNHEIYPKIGVAQSFVMLMPKVMEDIARECGEDSYPCRRLKSVGWDQVQDALMEALEELEKRERRKIPRPSRGCTNHDPTNKDYYLSEEEAALFRNRLAFAKHIPARRASLGMTTKDLAEESGLSEETVISIENFQHPASDEEMALLKLALDIK